MRLFRPLALLVLTAGLVVLANDLTAVADDVPTKADKKAKRKALLEAKAAEAAKAAEGAKPADVAKPAAPTRSAATLTQLIDAQITRRLAEGKVSPSPLCADDEFLRRAYLDITGVIPTADRARAFLDGTDPDKRARLIDELLASADYGRHQADIWFGLIVQRTSDNRRVDFTRTREWLTAEFNKNRPWSEVVSAILTATGPISENGAVGYFLSNNTVDKMTDACGKLFMGQQIQCAQCHNHPFTTTKQVEYWGMAQFFFKTEVGNIKAKVGEPSVTETPNPKRGKNNPLPESAKTLPAKFLGGEQPTMARTDPARPVLARWLTAPDNPYFARAMVNRTWAQFFGRGFVNPIDDMSPENNCSHPELLDTLAREFATGGFDLKHLIRGVCNSQAYQRSTKATGGNKADHELFSHMAVKVMTPEQLFDSLSKVTGQANSGGGRNAKGLPQGTARDQFVTFFLAGADSANTTEYEAGIPQALRLMNSPITGNPGVVRSIVPPGTAPADAVERVYLTALSRRPSAAEAKMLTEYLSKNGTTPAAYGDILWAVLNSSEFTLVR
jgi:hypothetical protein